MNTKYFVAWYIDGQTYKGTNLDDWKAFPDFGIICVMEYFERGRGIHANSEHYWYDTRTGRIDHGKGEGRSSFSTACPPPAYGVAKRAPIDMIPEQEYEVIMDKAMALEEV